MFRLLQHCKNANVKETAELTEALMTTFQVHQRNLEALTWIAQEKIGRCIWKLLHQKRW